MDNLAELWISKLHGAPDSWVRSPKITWSGLISPALLTRSSHHFGVHHEVFLGTPVCPGAGHRGSVGRDHENPVVDARPFAHFDTDALAFAEPTPSCSIWIEVTVWVKSEVCRRTWIVFPTLNSLDSSTPATPSSPY